MLSQYKISDSKIKLGIVNLFLFTLKLINVCFPMKQDKSDNAYPSNGEHNQSENDVADNEADEVPSSSMPCTNPAVPSDDV